MAKSSDPSSTIHTAGPLEASWLEDPLNYMIRAFIAFLQTIFEEAEPGHLHWSSRFEDTEIVITEENPIGLDALEQRPAISVIMGQTRFNGTSMDDLQGIDMTTGMETHTDLLPGTMSLNCLSKVRQESRFIAWICARTLWNLRKLFIKETHIHDVGRNITITPTTPAGALAQGDSVSEWVSTSVMIPYFLQWRDQVTPLKHDWSGRPIEMLQHIEMRLRTRMGDAQPNLTHTQEAGMQKWGDAAGPQLRDPTIRGRTISTQSVPIDNIHKV